MTQPEGSEQGRRVGGAVPPRRGGGDESSASDRRQPGAVDTDGVAPVGRLWRLVGLFLLNGLLWASMVPPWQAPDEPKHIEFAALIARRGPFAFAGEAASAPDLQAEIVASMDRHRFWWLGRAPGYDPEHPSRSFDELWLQGSGSALARTSPLYHVVLARLLPGDLLWGLYLARVLSVLLGGVVVLLAGMAARELFPADPLVRYGAPLVMALSPMFAFVHAGANNDAAVNALAALAFLLLARVLARGMRPERLGALCVTLVLAVAVKRIALVLVPASLMGVVAWGAVRSRRPLTAAAFWAAAAALAGLAAAGWWFRVAVPALPQYWRDNLGQYVFNDPGQWERIVAYARAPGVVAVMVEYAARLHADFWGSYGWALLRYPAWLYTALAAVTLIAACGVVLRASDRREWRPARAALLVFAASTLVTAAAAVAFFLGYLGQPHPVPPQGRYLFVAALPIAVVLAAGWGAWVPVRRRQSALVALGVAMAVFDVFSLIGVAAWFYFG